MNYVIIGNGVAGIEAAIAVRKNDPVGKIQIITESSHLYYYRPNIIDYLADEISADKLVIYKSDYYEKNKIETVLNTGIEKIIPEENSVVAKNGKKFVYDRLLLATGAVSAVPPVKGLDKSGVFTLRGIGDADRIKDYCKKNNRVIMVGGGLLGLESAYSLAKLGMHMTVIEFFKWLLPRQLDPEGGDILKKILEEKGLSFILNDALSAIEGNNKVERIVLKSGTEIKADAVVISAGVRSRIDLASGANIKVNNGIIVDDYMQTSVKNIYAAGDSIEHRGKCYGIWPAAKEQGKIAGLNMSGISTPYNGTIMANILKITGIDLYSAGDFNRKDLETLVSKGDKTYKKFLVDKTHPIAAIILGDSEAVKIARMVIDGKVATDELKKIF